MEAVRSPGTWTAPAASLASPLRRGDNGFSVGAAGKPLGLDTLDVVGHGLGFLRLGSPRGLRLLLRQLTRMHDDKAQGLLGDLPLALLHLPLAEPAVPMPTARRFVLRPPGLLD